LEKNGADDALRHISAMALKENSFRQWMDENKLAASELAGPLGVSVQTIHNWRSAGVPPRRQPYVRDTMARWHVIASRPMNSILITAGEKQFEQWSEAALVCGKTLVRWATDGLDELAVRRSAQTTSKAIPKQAKVPARPVPRHGSEPSY
jgi:hypothetical protein